jgi:signal transduction histidine kinase
MTYAQIAPEGARQWVLVRYAIISLFPYTFVTTVEALVGAHRRGLRIAAFGAGAALMLSSLAWPTLVFGAGYRIREWRWAQQTFYDFTPGPLAIANFALGLCTFAYVVILLRAAARARRIGRAPRVLVPAFGIFGALDITTVLGISDLPYLTEFGWMLLMVAVNRALLQEYFDLLQVKEKLETARANLLTNISHELRTPLGVSMGYLELLERRIDRLSGAEIDLARRARSALVEEVELIDQLIELIRFAAEKPTPQRAPVSLGEIVRGVADGLRVLADRRCVRLSVDISQDGIVEVDRRWFSLAVKNLVHNAIKFSPSGGEVRVHAEVELREARVRVEDDGPGIPLSEQRLVFDRFVQGSTSRAFATEVGLGIGLALVRDVIDQHEGAIELTSRPGKGSVFTVVVPRSAPPAVPHAD